jgi:polysaccharide biosynthesis transport protein
MLRLDTTPRPATIEAEEQTNFLPQLDLLTLIRLFARHWPRFVAVTGGVFLLALLYLLTATPKYTASFSMLFEPRSQDIMQRQAEDGQQLTVIDPGIIESQVEIMKSQSVALGAARALNLANDPDFFPKPGLITRVTRWFQSFFVTSTPPSQDELLLAAADMIASNVKVKRVGQTYVIDVSYTGAKPEMTAKIAAALADSYMENELQARYDSSRTASRWLQERLIELRRQVSDSDRAVQNFKIKNGIIDTSRGLVSEQQLADVNAQLISAQAAATEAKTRLDRVLAVIDGDFTSAAVSDALRSDVISRLRAQYLDLASKEAVYSQTYGKDHQIVVNLRQQMAQIAESAKDELKRIAAANRSDYEIAAARERSIHENLNALIAKVGQSNESQVTLRNLESSAQTYRALYDTFLQKFEQSTNAQTVPMQRARLITPPVVPDGKSWPKPTIVLGGGLALGMLLGFIAIVLKEMFGNTFQTPDDMRNFAGVECLGTLPALSRRETRKLTTKVAAGDQNILGFASPVVRQSVIAPFSRFTETVRNAKVSIDLARQPHQTPVIGIVSSVPKEGKTTFSANLALLTAQMGNRTLLIDGDLHSPSLTATLAPKAKTGVLECLNTNGDFAAHVQRDAVTGLDFLPAVWKKRLDNAVTVMTSQAMIDMIQAARQQYDYVFVDLPPIVPVVDAKAATFLFDGFIFIVEWGSTSRDVVRDAMTSAEMLRKRIIGGIINKADPTQLKRIEAYKGAAYGNYYIDAKPD